MMRHVRSFAAAALAVLVAPLAHAAVVTSVFDGRVPCVPSPGVGQACSSAGVTNRVESWDGVPLDVTVTIPPPEQNGPFPLIVDLHGFSAGKTPSQIQELVPQGYVVLIYSARGQHFSCGFVESRAPDPTLSNPNVCNERGWFHIADARYEVRDTQYLAGLLVDEGLVRPDIGVTGISFGGGQSLMLGALKNRMMMTDGTLVPWTSPGACTPTPTSPGCGVGMSIAAAAPMIGWSDVVSAAVPNGRTLDYRALNPYFVPGVMERAGVMKKSYLDVLFDYAGTPTVFYAPTGADPEVDIVAWLARLDQGEPYDSDPLLRYAVDELTTHHSGYYIDDSIPPAPLWIYNAFTDDIMPVVQALRFYRKTKLLHPTAEISMQFADHFAHPRGNLGSPSRGTQTARQIQHLRRHLDGSGAPLPGVEVFTQGCNGSSESGPFIAADWDSLQPSEVRLVDAGPKIFDSTGGDPANAAVDDPVGPTFAAACRTVPTSADDPGAATYRMPAASCTGYTLMGSPTVIGDFVATGANPDFAQIVGRLWDVAPDNSQSLVTHAIYRPRADNLGPQVFQLEPNGWQFAPGHVAKLELLGQSSPYARPSNGTFTITASNVELRLPVLETTNAGCGILPPAPPVLPPPDPEIASTPTPTATPSVAPPTTTPTATVTSGPGATVTALPTTTATPTPIVTPTPLVAQLVLGKKFQVKNPSADVTKRKVIGQAKEKLSNNTIVGNPTVNGASLRVIANGGTDSAQTFFLPKEGWQPIGTVGFKYANKIPGGAVRKARIKRTSSGNFQIKVLLSGKGGPLAIVPPNPGDDGGFIFTINGGDTYCVAFGGAAGGIETRDSPLQWAVKRPTSEVCP